MPKKQKNLEICLFNIFFNMRITPSDFFEKHDLELHEMSSDELLELAGKIENMASIRHEEELEGKFT